MFTFFSRRSDMSGLGEAFHQFGAKGANPRWSWSARTPDNNTVVMTFWKDGLKYQDGTVSYSNVGQSVENWTNAHGNKERIDNLKWARDNCGGLMRVVIVEAVDPNVRPRAIARAYAQRQLVMRLVSLNEDTGEFSAVSV